MYQLLADVVIIVHLAFIVFVIAGGLLLLRWPRLVWLHLPAVVWGAAAELMGWTCPLTPLENYFRTRGGVAGYQDDFIAHYLLGVIYPEGLTPQIQTLLGVVVIAVNAAVYALVIWRARQRRR